MPRKSKASFLNFCFDGQSNLLLSRLLIFFIFSLDLEVAQGLSTERCPKNLVTAYLQAAEWGKCYEFHTDERTWNGANNVCHNKGGNLVTIKEERIQKFLFKALLHYRWPRNGLWIGASDSDKEMDWRWVTGEKVKDGYNKWAKGQPSCSFLCLEDCAVMRWKIAGGEWHDYHCSLLEKYSFICEYNMLPEPTTTPTTTPHSTKTTTTSTTSPGTTPDTVIILQSAMQTSSQVVKDVMTTPVKNLNGSSDLIPLAVLAQNHDQSPTTSSLRTGTLAVIVCFVLVLLFVAVVLFIFFKRRRRNREKEEDFSVSYENPSYGEVKRPLCNYKNSINEDINDCKNNSSLRPSLAAQDARLLPQSHSQLRGENKYDTPPTSSRYREKLPKNTFDGSNETLASSTKRAFLDHDKNEAYTYDVPRSALSQAMATGSESISDEPYYYDDETNIYESLDGSGDEEFQNNDLDRDDIVYSNVEALNKNVYVPFPFDGANSK
ncbi:uncharacterized protein LOC131929357 isoform X2 [Physella acuta]|nr:uncharacterized protein LOC131929357 isoform X2 [Physella acuta]XP_059141473.1 uncharacterized protein LOC131929357 isoform X2 [Physella acuta]XP_059141474.1 uncharacterized protein LOC131929357 isoform X2 [Physella acuta]XP_059141475.1 uncharacterized protein LOC131929357 isoform X2 [Physella acuta]XP_059141476.1 uncharacterized protein LOC131929357 isoform X2 [Physella acuta]XP_059141477.1 uncharacterized protein LOC131929357 isoform X2 [Physella acuta]XP_059141478.1 uncharacterized prot